MIVKTNECYETEVIFDGRANLSIVIDDNLQLKEISHFLTVVEDVVHDLKLHCRPESCGIGFELQIFNDFSGAFDLDNCGGCEKFFDKGDTITVRELVQLHIDTLIKSRCHNM